MYRCELGRGLATYAHHLTYSASFCSSPASDQRPSAAAKSTSNLESLLRGHFQVQAQASASDAALGYRDH